MSHQRPNIQIEAVQLMSVVFFLFIYFSEEAKQTLIRGNITQYHTSKTHDRISNLLLTLSESLFCIVFGFMFICWQIYLKNNSLCFNVYHGSWISYIWYCNALICLQIAIKSHYSTNKYTIFGSHIYLCIWYTLYFADVFCSFCLAAIEELVCGVLLGFLFLFYPAFMTSALFLCSSSSLLFPPQTVKMHLRWLISNVIPTHTDHSGLTDTSQMQSVH